MSVLQYDDSVIGSAEEGFWLVCTAAGRITLSSSDAARFGLSSGAGNVADVIDEDSLDDLEDAMNIIDGGGDVSILMNASPSTGYSIAHLCSGILFGSLVAAVYLYKNKNEYLADSIRRNESIGRVFGYKGNREIDDKSAIAENSVIDLGFASFGRSSMQFLMSVKKTESRSRGDDDSSLTDVSKVFEMIRENYLRSEKKPFDAKFENEYAGTPVISNISQGSFVGIVLISAAIAAKLSEKKSCRVSFHTDAGAVTVIAESKMRRDHAVYCRSTELAWLHAGLGESPAEFLIFEYLLSFPGRDMKFRCDRDGNFVLTTAITTKIEVDRLKFRDSTLGVDAVTEEYIAYLNGTFSPDSQ